MPGPKVRKFKHDFQPPPSTAASLAPPLPAPVQASLLQVGMRVRKSLGAGYRTHAQAQAQWGAGAGSKPLTSSSFSSSSSRPDRPTTVILEDDDVRMSAADLDDSPGFGFGSGMDSLPSSQESAASVGSSFAAGRATPALPRRAKRPAHTAAEENSDTDEDEGEGESEGTKVAAAARGPFGASIIGGTHLRQLAQPKTRRRGPRSSASAAAAAVGAGATLPEMFKKQQQQQQQQQLQQQQSLQEQYLEPRAEDEDMDFGEADFLVPL